MSETKQRRSNTRRDPKLAEPKAVVLHLSPQGVRDVLEALVDEHKLGIGEPIPRRADREAHSAKLARLEALMRHIEEAAEIDGSWRGEYPDE